MKIRIAHSPDSDDAFMFYGLASGRLDTDGLTIEQVLADIETLNRAAFEGKYEVTAVSFHAYAHLADTYALLPHGASMGDRYGPMVVAPASTPDGFHEGYGEAGREESTWLKGRRVAIPGTLWRTATKRWSTRSSSGAASIARGRIRSSGCT